MPTVTLLLKIYQPSHLKIVEEYMKKLFKGLKIKIENVNYTVQNWIQISLSGEDEKAALNYLQKEIGLCPVKIENVEKFSTIKGYITGLSKSKEELQIDIGVISPKNAYAKISLQQLQAQLADGRKIALKKLIELYGLCENLPIITKITDITENHIEAQLAEKQINLYKKWTKALLERLIIIGAPLREIENALRESKSKNDIVEIQPLGLFEYTVACKLGTNAVGIIPKFGRKLPNATLNVFAPKKLLALFETNYFA